MTRALVIDARRRDGSAPLDGANFWEEGVTDELIELLRRARDTFEKLAKLGNGDRIGSSTGNSIAYHEMLCIDAISVPAAKAQEFNEKMVRFYLSKDATEMMDFLAGCHPDAEAIVPPPEEDRSHDGGMEP